MTKLTNSQQLVLASACAHADGIATRPAHLKPAQAAKTLAALVEAGLVREVLAKAEMPVWRHDEQGRAIAVRMLKAGRKIAADVHAASTTGASATSLSDDMATDAGEGSGDSAYGIGVGIPAGSGSKRTLIIALMRRERGATMDELTAATDWLPHTTRAALSGLRKSGIAVERTRAERGAASTYRIAAEDVAAAA